MAAAQASVPPASGCEAGVAVAGTDAADAELWPEAAGAAGGGPAGGGSGGGVKARAADPTTSGCEATPDRIEAAGASGGGPAGGGSGGGGGPAGGGGCQAAALLKAAAEELEAATAPEGIEAAAALLEAAAEELEAATVPEGIEAAAALLEAAAPLETAAKLGATGPKWREAGRLFGLATKPNICGSVQHAEHPRPLRTHHSQTFRLHRSHHTRVLRPRIPQCWQQPEAMARSRRARNLGWLSGNSP